MGSGMNQANSAGQQFLHHALFEGAGFFTTGFESGDFGIHVGEDGGDGLLFGEGGERNGNFT